MEVFLSLIQASWPNNIPQLSTICNIICPLFVHVLVNIFCYNIYIFNGIKNLNLKTFPVTFKKVTSIQFPVTLENKLYYNQFLVTFNKNVTGNQFLVTFKKNVTSNQLLVKFKKNVTSNQLLVKLKT